jgi:hypothetical protein
MILACASMNYDTNDNIPPILGTGSSAEGILKITEMLVLESQNTESQNSTDRILKSPKLTYPTYYLWIRPKGYNITKSRC